MMGWQPAEAVIYDCDTCERESSLQAPGKLPSGWKQEGDEIICEGCLNKRPCKHWKAGRKMDCDICQGKRCPDCKLQLDQEWHHYSGTGGWYGRGELVGISGHHTECQWIRKQYPQFFPEKP
jgi:hypothetical protein